MEIEEETFICSNSEYIDCSNEVDDPSDMCNSCQAEYDISMNYFRSLYEKDKLNSGPKDDREVWELEYWELTTSSERYDRLVSSWDNRDK